jgi:hypothetical protein
VDPFALVMIGGLIAVGLWVWLIGRNNQNTGLEAFGLRSAREITETREALEAEDLEQMIAANNERRRRRGAREITAADVEMQVAADFAEQRRRRATLMEDRELDELLAATNARRRARGLPERTREEARREFGGGAEGPDTAADG